MIKAIRNFFERLQQRRNPPIDGIYNALDEANTQYRQAVAQAIATERQLEDQTEKNRARAEEWHDKFKKATDDRIREQAFMRMTQYTNASEQLKVQIAAQKAASNSLLDRLGQMERPVQGFWLLKTFLAIFPEPSKTPSSLSSQLKDLLDLVRNLMLEQPSKEAPTNHWHSYYSKVFDLLDRMAKAFIIFASHYRNHPEDPEAAPFKERSSDFWWKLNEKAEKNRANIALWSERLKRAENEAKDELAQRALARTIEEGFYLPHYEKIIEALATAFDKPMHYEPKPAPNSSGENNYPKSKSNQTSTSYKTKGSAKGKERSSRKKKRKR